MSEVDRIQAAILELIAASGSWNAFDGPVIVESLRANRSLWRTAVLVGPTTYIFREESTGAIVRTDTDHSAHRGMPEVLYGYDTLELTPTFRNEDALKTLAERWGADTVDWIGFTSAGSAVEEETAEEYRAAGGDPDRVVLTLWWD